MDINARRDLLACNIADGSCFGSLYEDSIWTSWMSATDRLREAETPLWLTPPRKLESAPVQFISPSA
jgi:hypothetical protein